MQSNILKKFVISIIVFIVLIIGVDVIINFQIKKIKNGISEKNLLIAENSNKLNEVVGVKYVKNKIKKIENDFGMNIENIKKTLIGKIQKPNITQLSTIFQEIAQKTSSQLILRQKDSNKIEGEWIGTMDGFILALKSLQSSGTSLKFNKIDASLSQDLDSKIKKFIIKFEISII